MKIDATLTRHVDRTWDAAAELEAAGYDGLWVGETKHDPFLKSLQAADATEHVTVGTAVTVAFARSPMTLANTGFDLNPVRADGSYSGSARRSGRTSSAGSRCRGQPRPRMRELVLAMRAIWRHGHGRAPRLSRRLLHAHVDDAVLLAAAHAWGPPAVYVAGVGGRMTAVAGAVGDGFYFHPFTTDRYLRERDDASAPAGRAAAGHSGLGGVRDRRSGSPHRREDNELAAAIRGPEPDRVLRRRRLRTIPCSNSTAGAICSRN